MNKEFKILGFIDSDVSKKELYDNMEICVADLINSGQKIEKYTFSVILYPSAIVKITGSNEITRIVLIEKKINFTNFLIKIY